jgi:hypothetical protein
LNCSGVKVLVAYHQHVMLGEGAAQDGAVIGVDWFCEAMTAPITAAAEPRPIGPVKPDGGGVGRLLHLPRHHR